MRIDRVRANHAAKALTCWRSARLTRHFGIPQGKLLDAQAAHVLQPEAAWADGLSEMTKICALAG